MGIKIKILFFLLFIFKMVPGISQGIYKTIHAQVDFFSSAPIEDIKAFSQDGVSVLDTKTGEIAFQVETRSFQFEKALMQEHFNEKFMETAKYPSATFKGRIIDKPNLSKNGEYPVMLQGSLEIHGREQKRQIPATIQIRNDGVALKSEFKVACKDHDIRIPKILWQNIAEVVLVTISAQYTKL